MKQKSSKGAGCFTLISFIYLVSIMAVFQEMDPSVNYIENMGQFGVAILVVFSLAHKSLAKQIQKQIIR